MPDTLLPATKRGNCEQPMKQLKSNERIRVLCVIPTKRTPATKFSMIFAERQVAALLEAGLEVECFYLLVEPDLRTMVEQWRRLRETIWDFCPDVVHAQYGTVTALLSVLSSHVPAVITFRGSDLNPEPAAGRIVCLIRRLISELAALRANQIICVSPQLKARLWWRRSRAIVIPTGVDTEQFRPRPRVEARKQLGWKDDSERIVLFNAGGNPRIKRLDLAQAALDVAREICGDIRLVVINGEVPPDRVPLYMAGADLLLLTSDWEGSPTIVQEANACELPVVSVDVGDVRERLEGVLPSFIVPRDSVAIGRVIAEFLVHRRRSNGADRISECSNSVVIERTISAYRAAIHNNLNSPLLKEGL